MAVCALSIEADTAGHSDSSCVGGSRSPDAPGRTSVAVPVMVPVVALGSADMRTDDALAPPAIVGPSATPGATDTDSAPHPGSREMPRWDVGELGEPPRFRWSNWYLLLGPGLVMGSSAIGGGEWLTGPIVTAKYGGALLWLATLSILGQVVYNIEISRYTLYCGEPIYTGKFRTLPGPRFWLVVYLILDFGSVLPYLASNAAIPLFAVIHGRLPVMDSLGDVSQLKGMACAIFLVAMLPLIFGGKIYTTLKAIMSFKLVAVAGFLLFLAVFYSTWSTWAEILSGFVKFGNVPVQGQAASGGGAVANVFTSWLSGTPLPAIDFSMIGMLAAMAAISGNGGLTNTNVSNYTRDQGWGMGEHVGAIPSIVGGQSLQLSHQGRIFRITRGALERWRGWMRHIQRDQLAVWMPACFIGLALPSMLSVQFLARGSVPEDQWLAAGMTAQGVADAVGGNWGPTFWYLTLFCGFLVLGTSMAGTADGVLRRWVDVFWTASPRLRRWEPRQIGRFYFGVLCIYAAFGLVMLLLVRGDVLLKGIGMIYNFALGFSCLHTLVVNTTLLPRELRPGWFRRIALVLAAVFFTTIAVISTLNTIGAFKG
jgi:hypothetical protein